MPPFFPLHLGSTHQIHLAGTAVLSGLLVACAILSYQRLAQEERIAELKRSIPDLKEGEANGSVHSTTPNRATTTPPPTDPDDIRTLALARLAQQGTHSDSIILEQLARTRTFLTDAGLAKLRSSAIVVVGCGGVGSHAAAALARSGVGRIRLVDFDQVSLSSLNRHAVATLSDVGSSKVRVLASRLAAVVPWVRFELCGEKFDAGSAQRLLGDFKSKEGENAKAGFVVDAIDNIDSKLELLRYCHDKGIPVISSMGAGTKSDPTRVTVGDISTSTEDGLSRVVRRRLKLMGIAGGIPVVFSTETPGEGKAELLPLPEEQFLKGKEAVRELGALQDFRVRILPVLGTMPAVFGYTAANHVILSIAGYPYDYAPTKGREKLYDGIFGSLQGLEEKIVRRKYPGLDKNVPLALKLPITLGDVAFLVEDIYRGRSAITGVPTRLQLIRWELPRGDVLLTIGSGKEEQRSSKLDLADLVCMTKEEAARHQKEVLVGDKKVEEVYDREVVERVRSRREETRMWEKFR